MKMKISMAVKLTLREEIVHMGIDTSFGSALNTHETYRARSHMGIAVFT